MSEQNENSIDYKAVVDQLQQENETLRERLTDTVRNATPSPSPSSASSTVASAIDSTVEGIVLVVQKSDPMKIYIWACIGFMVAMVFIRLIEVIKE